MKSTMKSTKKSPIIYNSTAARKKHHNKHNKSVVEQVDDEDMDKILNDLRYFKEHISVSNNAISKNHKKEIKEPTIKKNKEIIESGDNTTAPSQQASRPRTSRGTRPSSKAAKRPEGGGHSAMGFHSNMPNHHLLYNTNQDPKHAHNKSVNDGIESPRAKRKLSKGRISPSTFVGQRQPSALSKHKNPKKNLSLENDKMNFIAKHRPQSANMKKKHNKSVERVKKNG